jgi:hypothetical protein
VSEEIEAIAEELRRVREAVSQEPLPERPSEDVLPPARPTRQPARAAREPDPEATALDLSAPDLGPLNEAWDLAGVAPGGRLARLVRRLLGPWLRAQTEFNARQVRFDNRALAWIEARLAHTHRHYDAVLGQHGRHMEEIDQRHLQLQEDLVAHVHDLVQRIDLVLADGERGRVSLELALRDLRARLGELEARAARGVPRA